MTRRSAPSERDARIDLMRGLALLSIFVDHIPGNALAFVTPHAWGFSDAAELFVLLAGFSTTQAYGRVFENHGLRVGLRRVLARCLGLYGTHMALLLATLLLVWLWERASGSESVIVGPMLRDGWQGAWRGASLRALPAYLDILPLYILLLGAFPLVRYGLAWSLTGTLAASGALWGAANVWHLNLPNIVDPSDPAHWYFDPLAWQLVFVLGCALAVARRRAAPAPMRPPAALLLFCWVYAIGACLVLDTWKLWPAPLPGNFYGTSPLLGILGNEPKTYVSPWRLLNVLALVTLALTSARLVAVARWRLLRPLVACGRHSLLVFALGCVLSLAGRLIFRTDGVTVLTQVLVNAVGLGALLALGAVLERRRAAQAERRAQERAIDAANPVA